MTVFQVWAPNASLVELKLGERQIPMTAGQEGWWNLEERNASHGTDYQFVLDSGRPLPDPRSPWQPEGPHGPSRVMDHSQFQWTDEAFRSRPLPSAIMYELHVATFTPEGTFKSAITKLDHLTELGITHIELMPVNEFPGQVGWGYDGVDLYAPHHIYGGPEGLKQLVDACHSRGIGVILDVVYNHLGPDGNYLGAFGPYFTDRYQTPWGDAINFDGRDSDPVRRFFIENALMWMRDYHFDGLRLDAVHAIIDISAIPFLEELAAEVEALSAQLARPLFLIAESDLNDPRLIRPRSANGYGFDAQWLDDFRHSLHTILTGEQNGYHADFGEYEQLAKTLRQGYVYDGVYSRYRGRRHGRPAPDQRSYRFIGFNQNHDQVGNRAGGERISHLISNGLAKVAAAFVLTSPFIPLLFMGEEWGASTPFQYFTDHQDPELAKAVREGRKREFAAFGWAPELIPDPQAPETSRISKLRWEELQQEPHRSMLDWYKRIIRLRKELPVLTSDWAEPLQVSYDEEARWFAFERGPIAVVCNLAKEDQEIPFELEGRETILLTSESEIEITDEGLPARKPRICLID